MVDRTALEMRHTRKCIGGSNPPLSAKLFSRTDIRIEFGNAIDLSSGEGVTGLFDQGKEKLKPRSILNMWEN